MDGRNPIPVEVKRGKVDVEGLEAFMRRFRVHSGYVVTPQKEETRKVGRDTIYLIPAYKFLLGTTGPVGSRPRARSE